LPGAFYFSRGPGFLERTNLISKSRAFFADTFLVIPKSSSLPNRRRRRRRNRRRIRAHRFADKKLSTMGYRIVDI
jgi:hypothetical protein